MKVEQRDKTDELFLIQDRQETDREYLHPQKFTLEPLRRLEFSVIATIDGQEMEFEKPFDAAQYLRRLTNCVKLNGKLNLDGYISEKREPGNCWSYTAQHRDATSPNGWRAGKTMLLRFKNAVTK